MTEVYWPFDAGAGSNITEDQWRDMARLWRASGPVLKSGDGLEVYADSTGLHVKRKVGEGWFRGHYYADDEEMEIAVDEPDLTDDRIDRIVYRADFVGNTITTAYKAGEPDPSPAPPGLTQGAGVWEFPAAQVLVAAGVVTIDPGDVTDERNLVPEPGNIVVARYRKDNGDQSIGNDNPEAVGFSGAVTGDDHGYQTANNLYTVPPGYGGVHDIRASAVWAEENSGRRVLRIDINGTEAARDSRDPVSGAGTAQPVGTGAIDLEDGDTIEVFAYQNRSSGALDIQDSPLTFITIARLGRSA